MNEDLVCAQSFTTHGVCGLVKPLKAGTCLPDEIQHACHQRAGGQSYD
jgi:hypothetical protein